MAASIASIEPIRDRWTGWTAVTTPIRGRADPGQLGDLAADVHAHLEDRRLVLGAEAQHRQRQADLVVLVALVAQRPEAPARTAAIASLVEVLAMLPVTPTTSGSNRRRQPAASAPSAASAVRDAHDGHVTERRRVRDGSGHDERGGAPRDGVGEERVAVGPFAREGDEDLARLDDARIDGGAADRSVGSGKQPAAGQAGEVVGGERGRRRIPAAGARRIDVGHGRPVSHRPRSPVGGRGSGRWVGR